MTGKKNNKYSSEFKQTIVNLLPIPVSHTHKYIRSMEFLTVHWQIGLSSISEVQIDDDTVLTAQQIKALQKKRNAQLEEENLILKSGLQYSTPHSDKD